MKEIFVPAVLSELQTVDPGEIRGVTLVLPPTYEIDGVEYPIRDRLRPGNAFLARPPGSRTHKPRRRMYTRSNCAHRSERVLETIINHTHTEKADTSAWWQHDEAARLYEQRGTIGVRVDLNRAESALVLYENSAACKPANLRLEPDGEWERMRFVGIALSTGITPLLAHLCYMEAFGFGRTPSGGGAHYTLIVSVRNPRQLMHHAELLALEQRFPDNVRYFPVLTREWPSDWVYGKGRIIRASAGEGREQKVDLGPLREIVPDLERTHVRFCGNASARNELQLGLQQHGCQVLSFRSEVW